MFKELIKRTKKIKISGEEDFSTLSFKQIISYFTVNSSIYVLVTFLQEALAFFLLPLYMAKLSSAEYGTLELIIICSGIAAIIMGLELYNVVSRKYFDWEEEGVTGENLFSLWVLCLGTSLVVGLILHFCCLGLLSKVFGALNYLQLDYAILLAFFTAQQYIPRALMRIKGELTLYSLLNLGGFIIGLSANLYLILIAKQGVRGAIMGQLLTTGFIAGGYLFYTLYNCRFNFNPTCVRESLKFALPMIPGTLGNTISVTIDRIILGKVLSTDALGLYSYARKLGQIVQAIVQIVKTAWLPFYIRIVSQRKNDYQFFLPKISNFYTLFMLAITLVVATFAKEMLYLLGGDKYLSINTLVSLFAFGGFIFSMYFVFSNGIIMSNKTYVYSVTIIGSLFASMAGNLILIPVIGIYGGAVAYLLSNLFMTVSTAYFSQKYFYIPYHFKQMSFIIITAVILFIICHCLDSFVLKISIALKAALLLSYTYIWSMMLLKKKRTSAAA